MPALPAGVAVQALCPGSCAACPEPAQLLCPDDPSRFVVQGTSPSPKTLPAHNLIPTLHLAHPISNDMSCGPCLILGLQDQNEAGKGGWRRLAWGCLRDLSASWVFGGAGGQGIAQGGLLDVLTRVNQEGGFGTKVYQPSIRGYCADPERN
jgi:hypothetical protein